LYKDELLEVTLDYNRLYNWVYTNEEKQIISKFWKN